MWMRGENGDASVCLPIFFFSLLLFPAGAGLYILQLMSERLAPSARGGLSLSDGFPVSICQVRLCTARRSPLLSPGYLLPLSPAGSAAAPGRCQQRRRGGGRFRGVLVGRHRGGNGCKIHFEDWQKLCFISPHGQISRPNSFCKHPFWFTGGGLISTDCSLKFYRQL